MGIGRSEAEKEVLRVSSLHQYPSWSKCLITFSTIIIKRQSIILLNCYSKISSRIQISTKVPFVGYRISMNLTGFLGEARHRDAIYSFISQVEHLLIVSTLYGTAWLVSFSPWWNPDTKFEQIKTSWSCLAGPLTYLRPVAAPKADNIAVAEKLFAELKLTKNDMRRAFLVLDQIPPSAFVYRSSPLTPTTGNIFNIVIPRNAHPMSDKVSDKNGDHVPAASITFAKFVNEVLPIAEKLEYKLPKVD